MRDEIAAQAETRQRTRVNDIHPGRRYAWNETQEREWHPDIDDEDFWGLTRELWDYTVLGTAHLWSIYATCQYVFRRRVPGDIVECGVFLGGALMFFVEMCRRYGEHDRVIFGLDTFHGFVRRTEKDVDYKGRSFGFPSPGAPSLLEAVRGNVMSVGWHETGVRLVEGDVAETAALLPSHQVAILRLDTDTYDTTRVELENLYWRVPVGGVVMVDDYGWARGQREAVDEFFAEDPVCLFRVSQYCSAFVRTA